MNDPELLAAWRKTNETLATINERLATIEAALTAPAEPSPVAAALVELAHAVRDIGAAVERVEQKVDAR